MAVVEQVGQAVADRRGCARARTAAVLHHDVGLVRDLAQEGVGVAGDRGRRPCPPSASSPVRRALVRDRDRRRSRPAPSPRARRRRGGGEQPRLDARRRAGPRASPGDRLQQAGLRLLDHRRRRRAPLGHEHHVQRRPRSTKAMRAHGEVDDAAHQRHDGGEGLVEVDQAAGDAADLRQDGGLVQLAVEQLVDPADRMSRLLRWRLGEPRPRAGGLRAARIVLAPAPGCAAARRPW